MYTSVIYICISTYIYECNHTTDNRCLNLYKASYCIYINVVCLIIYICQDKSNSDDENDDDVDIKDDDDLKFLTN